MRWFLKKESRIVVASILLLSLVCCAYVLIRQKIELRKYKEKFEAVMQSVETDVPVAMQDALKNNEWVESVEVTINSSLTQNKGYDNYDWDESIVVNYRVKKQFDDLTNVEKYYIIEQLGQNALSWYRNIASKIVPDYDVISNTGVWTENEETLKKIYGKPVWKRYHDDVILDTGENQYEYCHNIDYYFVKNDKDVYVKELVPEPYTSQPYPGMSESSINDTKLGHYSSYDGNYNGIRPECRARTYYWTDSSGHTIFSAWVFRGEVTETTDFRVKPIETKRKEG